MVVCRVVVLLRRKLGFRTSETARTLLQYPSNLSNYLEEGAAP